MNPALHLDALGIIAGNGRYPILLAEAARARGVKRIAIVGFSGETAPEVEKLADHYTKLRVGQLGGLCDYFRDQRITQAIMAGQIAPGNLFDLLPDLKGALLLARLKERNAETIFAAIADELKAAGVHLLPATTFLEDSLPEPGHIAGPKLSNRLGSTEMSRTAAVSFSGPGASAVIDWASTEIT